MVLLAVLAGHAELPAVDGDVDLRHRHSSSLRIHGPARPARSGWCRSRHRAGARSRGWWSRARATAPSARRDRRRAASGRRRARASARPALARRGRPRAGARPPPRAHRAPAPDAGWRPRSRSDRSWLASSAPAESSARMPENACVGKELEREPYVLQRLWRQRSAESLSRVFAACAWLQCARAVALDSRPPRASPRPSGQAPMNAKASTAAAASSSRHGDAMPMTARAEHDRMANAIRALAMDAVEQAKSGHPGLPMGAADIATVLFTQLPEIRPGRSGLARPRPLRALGRPRLDAALRAAASARLRGDDDRRAQALPPARLDDAGPSGEFRHARASRPPPARSARASPTRSAWRSPSGIWRPSSATSRRPPHLRARLRRRPDGRHQPGGDRARRPSEAQQADRAVRRQRHLHRRAAVARRLGRPGEALRGRRLGARRASTATIPRRSPPRSSRRKTSDRPTLIACKTTIGFGAPTKAGTEKSHGSPLGADEIKGAREKLGWSDAAVRGAGRHPRRLARRRPALARPRARPGTSGSRRCAADKRAEFERRMRGDLPTARSTPRSAR